MRQGCYKWERGGKRHARGEAGKRGGRAGPIPNVTSLLLKPCGSYNGEVRQASRQADRFGAGEAR